MKAGDRILNATLVAEPDLLGYCLLLELESDHAERSATRIHCPSAILSVNVDWLKGSAIKALQIHNETGDLIMGLTPNRNLNPLVPQDIDYFQWRMENPSGDLTAID